MWGMISGVEKTSPRQEIPHCIDHPMFNGGSLTVSNPRRAPARRSRAQRAGGAGQVGDYKLIIGLQSLSFHQGPDYPNGTKGTPYRGFNYSLDCGNNVNMEGGVRWWHFLDLSYCPSH